ncbi:MAG TPA: septum formation initiator family protein [Verrucomicrobiae bacterium]|nr:septum formation initiator family protein [Verrucomicrobiae bacterium]
MDRRIEISGARAGATSFAEQFKEFLHRNLTWFLIAGLVLLLIQDIFGTHGVLAMRRSQLQAESMQKQIQELNEENQQLQSNVKSLKSDPTAIERIAREQMGLARPGEFVFKIQPGDADSKAAAPATAAPSRHPAQ